MKYQINKPRLPQWVGEHENKIAKVEQTENGLNVTSRYEWSWPCEGEEPMHHLTFEEETEAAEWIAHLEPDCQCTECQMYRHYTHETRGPVWLPHRKLERDPNWLIHEWLDLEGIVYTLQQQSAEIAHRMQCTDEPITHSYLETKHRILKNFTEQLRQMTATQRIRTLRAMIAKPGDQNTP